MKPESIEDYLAWGEAFVDRLDKRINRIDEQIAMIESLTRENLPTFPDVFRKAASMLDEAEDQFWMLNYTPAFGMVHAFDKHQLNAYWKIGERRAFETDHKRSHDDLVQEVRDFSAKLTTAAGLGGIVDFRLATVGQGAYEEGFLTSTIGKMSGQLLDPHNPGKAPDVDASQATKDILSQNHSDILSGVQAACEQWQRNLKAFRIKTKGDSRRGVVLMDRVPFQIFISDRKESAKKHCLVFNIGDFNVDIERRITGFHTSQAPLITLFEDIFVANVESFQKRVAVEE